MSDALAVFGGIMVTICISSVLFLLFGGTYRDKFLERLLGWEPTTQSTWGAKEDVGRTYP